MNIRNQRFNMAQQESCWAFRQFGRQLWPSIPWTLVEPTGNSCKKLPTGQRNIEEAEFPQTPMDSRNFPSEI
jgi:hypothetical protein